MRYILLIPFTLLSTIISATMILLFSFFVSIQKACPYSGIGSNNVDYKHYTIGTNQTA